MASASYLQNKTYDFGCFSQDLNANGLISDPSIGNDFSKDFRKSEMRRTCSPSAVYNHPDESMYQETISEMEKCMKRHTGDLMRFLEGISSRLSQLELYCYNVDKSVGEMRSNMGQNHEETDSKLKFLERQLTEVGQSVRILRDKQEIAETKKELDKLQLARKEILSAIAKAPHYSAGQSTSTISDTSEVQNQHLAVVLRQQGASQPHSIPKRHLQVPITQPAAPAAQVAPQHYCLTSSTFNIETQVPQSQYQTSHAQYKNSEPLQQNINHVRVQPGSGKVSQQAPPPQFQQFIQYQRRSQQSQQMLPGSTQQHPTHAQSQPNSASGYPPHQPNQQVQQATQEAVAAAAAHADVLPNGYVERQMPPQPPTQQIKADVKSHSSNVHTSMRPQQSLFPTTHMTYKNEDASKQPHHSQGRYPPANIPAQHPQHVSILHNQPQFARSHPYTDHIQRLVNMGFRADLVVAVIRKMEESDQAVNFNVVLDTLNEQSSSLQRPVC